jgi:ornithine carbamoyltransferase
VSDLTDEELAYLVCRSHAFAVDRSRPDRVLDGRVIGVYFRLTSTRTRTAFMSGAMRLGASVIAYGPGDLQLNTGESIEDTAEVLSRMLDGLVVRTPGDHAELRALAGQRRMSIINAMTADEHPTQALADLSVLLGRFGALSGLRVLYVGEGNNTAAALALAFGRVHLAELFLRTPPGYGVSAALLAAAQAQAREHQARIEERHDLDGLPADVDVVYTSRWQTTGTVKPTCDWPLTFAPFRVDERLMGRYPRAVFMHDLPAHRGQEVDAGVLDGPASIAFDQAQHKLFSAMAVLEWCLSDARPTVD